MAINQTAFLGYLNTNGVTSSMRDVQAAQMKFWMDVYIAATRDGADAYVATMRADAANEKFKERFVPQ